MEVKDGMSKLLIIGGNPKGYPEPFSYETRSGKVLRKILSNNSISAQLMDLWESQEDEVLGEIKQEVLNDITSKYVEGYKVVVVGRYMYTCVKRYLNELDIHYLPHPASRTTHHRKLLERGLRKLSSDNN